MLTPNIGCDLVMVADVADSIERFGDIYLRRVYTEHELATCAGPLAAQRLAARFAAKEATIKVLRVGRDDPMSLKDIEICSQPGGEAVVVLHAAAAAAANSRGLCDFQVSMSHESVMAMAIVAASVSHELSVVAQEQSRSQGV
jgi:holo-[acyl-carrier protein] synthase